MSDSAAPAAKVEDSEFPRVFRSYSRTKQYDNPPANKTVLCEEIEYADGKYELRISGKKVKDITSEVEERRQKQKPIGTIRTYKDIEHNSSGDVEVWCKEIEYPPNTPDGQYQLWISDKYKKDITSEMKRRQEQLPLAWPDTRADLDEFVDFIEPKKQQSIKSMLGQLQCLV